MNTPVIIDIIAAGVLFGLTVFGALRGLFRALAGLAVALIALVGAGLIASALSVPAAKMVAPAIESRLESRLDEALQEHRPTGGEVPLADLLDLLGVDEARRETLAGRAEELVRETGADLATALIESAARSVLYGILYMISFALLSVVLHLLVRLMDSVFQLPVLHSLNAWGGGAVGFLEGALLLFLAVWVLRLLGVSLPTEGAGPLARFFLTHTPLEALKVLGI